MPMYYVYILKLARNNKFYIGYTENLRRRIKEHQKGNGEELIYYEAFQSKKKATRRERKLKYYGSAWRALKQRIGCSNSHPAS